jgi:hypothetical protein
MEVSSQEFSMSKFATTQDREKAVMDTIEALRRELDGWKGSAAEFCSNQQYYSGLIDQAAKHIGLPMYTADDDGVHETPLRIKLPECVEHLAKQLAAMITERDKLLSLIGLRNTEIDRLCDERIASQAREQQLREGMLNTANGCRIWGGEAERARKMLEHYLALPHDDTALKQYGVKVLRDAKKLYSPDDTANDFMDKIDRMADELETPHA